MELPPPAKEKDKNCHAEPSGHADPRGHVEL